jgi:molybdenum cofactor cytidylyltransferase
MQVLTLLLAAGSGRRFDPTGARDKLAQALPGGDSVAVASAKNLLAAGSTVLAVVRANDSPVAQQLRDLGCTVSECKTAAQGVSASLIHAVTEAEALFPAASGWLIALADMPYVQAATIGQLRDAIANGADIAAPVHQGRRGNPVAFSRFHLPRLLTLQGDSGARQLLQAWPVVTVAVDDAGILHDIDVAADLSASTN